MKVSVFTPTHNPEFLLRARDSLVRQTYRDFEWIVMPNHGAIIDEPTIGEGIPELKVFSGEGLSGIGMLKNSAANLCSGEILVELDHDDELTPNALQRLAEEFTKDKCLDFVYSNSCCIDENNVTGHYSMMYGWKYLPFTNDRLQTVSFKPSPASFGKIWYAPDHVRAWRSKFYQMIGGHDKTLPLLDDHDLVCRTYIHGKVKHIDECLYVYHIGNNTYSQKWENDYIQKGTLKIYDKYIEQMVKRWCEDKGLMQVTLKGDGMDREGTHIYGIRDHGRWPFEDNSVGVFHANQALPYFENPIHAMEEIYRCLTPNGWLLSTTPSTDGRGAFMNPNYKSRWNANSFLYYTNMNFSKHIGTPVKFQCFSMNKKYYPEEWYEQAECPFVSADLIKLPQHRIPGHVEFPRTQDEMLTEPED